VAAGRFVSPNEPLPSKQEFPMDRRLLLASLTAAVAAPVFAQQSNQSAGTPPNITARSGLLGPDEMQHIQQTLQLGMVALETSRIALQKARNDNLKQFAQFESDEQTTLAQVLHTMMDPTAPAATGATTQSQPAQTGSSASSTPAMAASSAARGPDSVLDTKGREMIQKLQQASDAEFDKAYLAGQIEGHRDLLQVQERYLSSNPQNINHVNVVKLARGQIKEHIALLANIQNVVR
jgi:putative membrane protein